MMNRSELQSSLEFLGELLDTEKTPDVHLVVSGGAALMARDFVARTTIDLDVFAQREIEGDFAAGHPLPDWFRPYIQRVARENRLPENWINATTALIGNLLDALPLSTLQDLKQEEYGERLRISYLGRDALIYSKVYACMGRNEARDSNDLLAMSPTSNEIEKAAEWALSADLVRQDQINAFFKSWSQSGEKTSGQGDHDSN